MGDALGPLLRGLDPESYLPVNIEVMIYLSREMDHDLTFIEWRRKFLLRPAPYAKSTMRQAKPGTKILREVIVANVGGL